ncbi:MAG: hypothetical protein K0S38_795 [Candidatus Paceibacter sp.]|jgi:hypothetical protein|nr:hypothetical protein [Candidatus Paceibacter sp.]
MNNLGGFFDKFKHIFTDTKFQKSAVISTINMIAKIQIDENDIEVKDYKIVVKGSPALKSTIYMHKQKILAELKNILGTKAPNDIR